MIHNRKHTFMLLFAALAAAALLLLAACGGDDDDGDTASGSPTGDATPDASGSPAATEPDGSPVETPGGSPGGAVTCTEGDAQRGLLSELDFNSTEGVFESGDEVEMTMTLINCGDNDVTLTFPTTQRYITSITTDPAGVEVYNSADGQAYSQVEGQEVIPPEESIIYVETWDQADKDGAQVPDGRYKVSMLSVGCGTPEATDCRFGPIKYIQIGEVQPTDGTAETGEATATP